MQYLYDESGRIYLDAVNNVNLVHHPRVVKAGQGNGDTQHQHATWHDNLVRYARRLYYNLTRTAERYVSLLFGRRRMVAAYD